MTILSTIQTVCRELSLDVPSQVISSTDSTTIQLLAYAERAGKEVRNRWRWAELNREFLITLVADQANYAFNSDHDYSIPGTFWDRSNRWDLIGPIAPAEWQLYKSGIITLGPRRRFRIKGAASSQLYLDPTPASDEADQILVLEYQSKSWVRPIEWAASTVFDAGSYCFYNGNWYSTTAGGTSGSTAPTHTSSSASDGGVTWAYFSGSYDTFIADTDVSLLDEDILAMDIQWRFRRDKGLEFEDFRKETQDAWKRAAFAKRSGKILSLTPTNLSPLIRPANIPDTNYGS